MSITRFHAKYFANELTKRLPSDGVEKLAGALADAQVDLNPHQIEAALFAFRSPLSKGAVPADEVGLGKTIEAGIMLSQRRQLRQLETKRDEAWRANHQASREVDRQKDAVLDDISTRLAQRVEREVLFTPRRRLEAA